MAVLSYQEIADRIHAHLKRWENDPEINVDKNPPHGQYKYFHANCFKMNKGVGVSYISYQGHTKLGREEAIRYLEMLDNGYIGRHFEAFR